MEADARVGGRYRVLMHWPGGARRERALNREPLPEAGLHLGVEGGASLYEPHEFAGHRPHQADGAGTVLTLTHERLFDEESRAGHEKGWIGAFDKLEKLVHLSFATRGHNTNTEHKE